MARIRSVHPGLWTDEDFVQLSAPARLFLIGMWNESDDYGLFEWKPTRLKMRLAPNDPIDAAALMAELVEHRFLIPLERDGRALGMVRNFRKYQRPKTPSAPIVPVDGEIASAIGIDKLSDIPASHRRAGEGHPQPTPKAGEKPVLMEDGGGRVEEEGDKLASLATPPADREPAKAVTYPPEFERFWEPYPCNAKKFDAFNAWQKTEGLRPPEPVLLAAVEAYKRGLDEENARRRGGDLRAPAHASSWLNGHRWEEHTEAAEKAVSAAAERESKRFDGLPACWRPAAERFAEKHGWQAWDNAMLMARLRDGDAGPEIEFSEGWQLNNARDSGLLKKLATALGADPIVTVRGKAAA